MIPAELFRQIMSYGSDCSFWSLPEKEDDMPTYTDLEKVRLFTDDKGEVFLISSDERLEGRTLTVHLEPGTTAETIAWDMLNRSPRNNLPHFTPQEFDARVAKGFSFALGSDDKGIVSWDVEESLACSYAPNLLLSACDETQESYSDVATLLQHLSIQAMSKKMNVFAVHNSQVGISANIGRRIEQVDINSTVDFMIMMNIIHQDEKTKNLVIIDTLSNPQAESDFAFHHLAEFSLMQHLLESTLDLENTAVIWVHNGALNYGLQSKFTAAIAFGNHYKANILHPDFSSSFTTNISHGRFVDFTHSERDFTLSELV